MKHFCRYFLVLAQLLTAQPAVSGNEGHGGGIDIGEFKSLAQSSIEVLKTFEDVLRVDIAQYRNLVQNLVVDSFKGSDIDPFIRKSNSGYQINATRWGQLSILSLKQSFVINFYLERLRHDHPDLLPSTDSPEFTGGRWGSADGILTALDLIQVEQQVVASLRAGEFPKAKAAQMDVLGPLILSLADTWVISVDQAFLKGKQRSAVNFANNELKLILLSHFEWLTALTQSFAIGRLAQVAMHEFVAVAGFPEGDHYRFSGDFRAWLQKIPRFPDPKRKRIQTIEDPSKFGHWECRNLFSLTGFALHLTQRNSNHWTLKMRDPSEQGSHHDIEAESAVLNFAAMPKMRGVLRFALNRKTDQLPSESPTLLTIDTETKASAFLGNGVISNQNPSFGFLGDVSLRCTERK